MSAAKRPASSSPSPVSEAKKHHIDDAGTITELNDDTVSADYQGDMSTSSWWDDDMAISRPTSGSPSLSPTQESQKYISDDTATIASCGDKIGSADNLKGSGTSDEQDHAGKCPQHPVRAARPSVMSNVIKRSPSRLSVGVDLDMKQRS